MAKRVFVKIAHADRLQMPGNPHTGFCAAMIAEVGLLDIGIGRGQSGAGYADQEQAQAAPNGNGADP
ncbi:hypothetical protein SDC9_136905 [bioreactor metagenome]|uniref:Uncharacterized protein n=1 Tax=bioreactor metagenome TaxID=1076179 RepID=A0A645DLY4_9ZZZZ